MATKTAASPKRESPNEAPKKFEPVAGELLPGTMIFVDFEHPVGQPDKGTAVECKVLEHHRVSTAGGAQGSLTSLLTVLTPNGDKRSVSTGRVAF